MLVEFKISSDKNPVSVAEINPSDLMVKPFFLQIAQDFL